jgi:hypothetical protein
MRNFPNFSTVYIQQNSKYYYNNDDKIIIKIKQISQKCFLLVFIESFSSKILFNSSSPTVANRPSVMFVYMKQKIQWRMFAKTRNLIGRLKMKSRLWLENVETPNRPPEAHARWTHTVVQPRKYCLGQSAKSKIPYHLIMAC